MRTVQRPHVSWLRRSRLHRIRLFALRRAGLRRDPAAWRLPTAPSPRAFPQTQLDLDALMTLAVSQVPLERAPDLRINRSATSVSGRRHPERVVKVLANLLDNAVKYSVPGTIIEVESYWITDAGG